MLLITGGRGFLGTNLAHTLPENQGSILLDNLFKPSPLPPPRNSKLIEADISTYYEYPTDNVEGIYNLASIASPVYVYEQPLQTINTIVMGTINMLRLATALRVPLLQASTSEIYGDPTVSPQPESYTGSVNPVGKRACYNEAKRMAETLCFEYNQRFNTQVRIARIFNTYGPGMPVNDERVIPNFILQALQNKPITVKGSGTQTRSFCYVDDMIRGLTSLFQSSYTMPVNIGNPHNEMTMLELASEIKSLVGSRSEIIHLPVDEDDPTNRCPDITLAKDLLSWEPTVGLIEGLTKTISYFDEQLAAQNL